MHTTPSGDVRGDIDFVSTVDGAKHLEVTSSGVAIFGGEVHVGSVDVTRDDGFAYVDGGRVETLGAQEYKGDVKLNVYAAEKPVTFQSTQSGPIEFSKSLTSGAANSTATVTTGGLTTFGGAVAVGSLTADGGDKTVIAGPLSPPRAISALRGRRQSRQ